MKKNMFTETEMTSLLFTHEKENGVRSTLRGNLAFELCLEQCCSVTRQNFHDLEAVPGAAEQMPHHTVDLLGTERGIVISTHGCTYQAAQSPQGK